MERIIVERFLNKRVVFHKKDNEHTLVGKLIQVTDTSILIEFKGQLQAHNLEDIIDMSEGYEGGNDNE